MKIKIIRILICIVLVTGCNREAEEIRLKAMEREIESLKNQIEELRRQKAIDDFYKDVDKIAYLTPGDIGYSVIRFDLGVLTLSLVDIKPYANGSKITLQIGNPLSASIEGLKVTIEWGKVTKEGSPINEEAKSKEVTLEKTLRSGTFSNVTLVLDGVPPTDFGFVRLKEMTHTSILLSKNK